jgi:aspartate aminotransferase
VSTEIDFLGSLSGTLDFSFFAGANPGIVGRANLALQSSGSIPGVEIIEPSGAFYAFPCIKTFIGRRAPNGQVMQTDSDLTTYLLHEGKVAGVQCAAFGLSPYLRISYALSRADLRTAVERIRDALGALD